MGPGPESAQFNRALGNRVLETFESALANPLNQLNRIGSGQPQPYDPNLSFDDVFQGAGLPPWMAGMMAFMARMFSDPVPGPPTGTALRRVGQGSDLVPTPPGARGAELSTRAQTRSTPIEVLSPEEYRLRTSGRDVLDDFDDVVRARQARFGDDWVETVNVQPPSTGNIVRDFPDRVFTDDAGMSRGIREISEQLLEVRFPNRPKSQLSRMAEDVSEEVADELYNLMYNSQSTPHGYREMLGSEVLEYILPLLREMQ